MSVSILEQNKIALNGLASMLGPLSALGSSLTWALGSSVYARWARTAGALEVNLSRAVIVWPLFLIATLLLRGAGVFGEFTPVRVGWLVTSTVCSFGVGDLLFYGAALRLGTSTALAIASVYPVWAAVLGALTLGEQLTPGRLWGTVLCVGGVAWLVLLARSGDDQQTQRSGVASGAVLALLTSVFWAGNTYTVRRGAVGIPLLAVNALRFGMTVMGLGVARMVGRWRGAEARPRLLRRQPGVLGFAVAAIIEGFCGSSMFVYGLSHSDLAVAAPLSSLAPLFAVPVGILLGGERIGLRRLLAIVIIVGGIVLLVR